LQTIYICVTVAPAMVELDDPAVARIVARAVSVRGGLR